MAISAEVNRAALVWAMMFISRFLFILWLFFRKNSRTCRLIRFLVGAWPTLRVTVTPKRAWGDLPAPAMARKWSVLIFRPGFDKRRKSSRFKIRFDFGNENETVFFSSGATIFYFFACFALFIFSLFYFFFLSEFFLKAQPFSASRSSAIDNSSALFGGHSFQKAVFPGSFSVTGLICSFHCLYSFS